MTTTHLFCGFDERESPGFHVFVSSVLKHASKPVAIHALASMGLPEGSNSFTLSRFLLPWLMGFKGHAIFADASDMMMLGDVSKLDELFDKQYAVQVVKHDDYISQHERKYIGTAMECAQSNYSRKNWASLMIVNCEHSAWFGVTPKAVSLKSPMQLLQFQDLLDSEIGGLPKEWNVLVDEGQDVTNAQILHWTAGIPTFKHYQNARASKDWHAQFDAMTLGMAHG